MKPLYLKMQAFGPYAAREIVDFRSALDAGLFGIYGATGSGKSSIFSAITFALFDESATGNQESSSLRSDHAKPDCKTEVELIFEIGEKRYLIRRRPEQKRPAFRGKNETTEKHSAELFDVSDIKIEDISEQNYGIILAERKTRDVESCLNNILGYGAEQFRQIILLPQGKFETFLTAKTDERLEILRKLFDVSLYKRLAEKLKEDAKTAEDNIKQRRGVCSGRLNQEGYVNIEALATGIESERTRLLGAENASKTASAAATDAETAFAMATGLNSKFIEVQKSKESLNEIEKQSKHIEDDKLKLSGAQKAHSLIDIEIVDSKAQEKVKSTLGVKDGAIGKREQAKITALKASKLLDDEQKKAPELDRLKEEAKTLERYKGILSSATNLQLDYDDKNKIAQEHRGNLTQAETNLKNLQNLQLKTQEKLEKTRRDNTRHVELQSGISTIRQQLAQAHLYYRAETDLTTATKKFNVLLEEETSKIDDVKRFNSIFENAELALAGAQALHLAEKLVDGIPCPVCGSAHHPFPVQGTIESVGLDKAFRDAKSALETVRSDEYGAKLATATQKGIKDTLEAAFQTIIKPEKTLAQLDTDQKDLKTQIDNLSNTGDDELLEKEIEIRVQELSAANTNITTLRGDTATSNTTEALAKQALSIALSTIPEEFREVLSLENKIELVNEDIKLRQDNLEKAIDEERKFGEAFIIAQEAEKNANKQYDDAVSDAGDKRKQFQERLSQNAFTFEGYKQHKSYIEKIPSLEDGIKTYNDALNAAKSRAELANKAVLDLTQPDLETLQLEKEKISEARNQAITKKAIIETKLGQLNLLQTQILQEQDTLRDEEIKFTPLNEIAKAFSGNNSRRLHLETFAIGAMFDRVLQAANLRLSLMSYQRYSLVRELDNSKNTGQRGLGINVDDTHTGKPRSASTLSGGETFMAALSLALGLSDVVQSLNGGIRIDTLFIDEGFGTLDDETLEETMKTLQSLQNIGGQSRAIGLISHVEKVQNMVPNGFQIKKTVSGSHVGVCKLKCV